MDTQVSVFDIESYIISELENGGLLPKTLIWKTTLNFWGANRMVLNVFNDLLDREIITMGASDFVHLAKKEPTV